MPTPFLVQNAAGSHPIVASLPHSGLRLTDEMRQQLRPNYQSFLPHQDWHLTHLYDFLTSLGITTLQACYSRYVVDLNRALTKPYFGDFWRSPIAAKTAYGKQLYQHRPSEQQICDRIEQYYQPYHTQLKALLDEKIQQFGKVFLLDLHSFHGPITDDICLGNVNGRSCSERFTSIIESAFHEKGYQVVRNKVFNGGHITRHYGQSSQIETLQIEVRYPVYLDSQQLDLPAIPDWQVPHFYIAKQRFQDIFKQITQSLRAQTNNMGNLSQKTDINI
ncbi:MAG: N-formylglutamate amidohydrolase [Cyanobacteria bacterium P01_F01_bin.4]